MKEKQEVIKRCEGLMLLSYAAYALAYKKKDSVKDAVSDVYVVEILNKLNDKSNSFFLTDDDLDLTKNMLNSLSLKFINEALWKLEELGTLLWAGQILKYPSLPNVPYNESIYRKMKDFQQHFVYREMDELIHYREKLKTLSWRYDIKDMKKSLNPFKLSKKKKIKKGVTNAFNKEKVEEMVDKDIGIDGVKYEDLNDEEKNKIERYITFRIKTIDWLID